jgi:hypothetical protein
MKKYVALLVAAVALAMSHSMTQAGEGQQSIPLQQLAGGYSFTAQGSFAGCFSQSFVEEPCDTAGVVVFPVTALVNGQVTMDTNGNGCATLTATISNLPVDATPPLLLAEHAVFKLHDYDPGTGSGDFDLSNFKGGKCNGADFDDTGATAGSTSTQHFVASNNGKRIDSIETSFIDHPVNGIGDFSLAGIFLKQ